jgi:hypothetical protein
VLGGIAQNNVLTTIRKAEVLGDSTPALALECARRRRELVDRTPAPVRLASSQRVMRLQPFDFPGFNARKVLAEIRSCLKKRAAHGLSEDEVVFLEKRSTEIESALVSIPV